MKVRKVFTESTDAIKLSAYCSAELGLRVDIKPLETNFHLQIDSVSVGDLWIATVATDTGYWMQREERPSGRFKVHFVHEGGCEIVSDGGSNDLSKGHALLSHAQSRFEITVAPRSRLTILIIPLSNYPQIMGADTVGPVGRFMSLQPQISVADSIAQVVLRISHLLLAPIEQNSPFEVTPNCAEELAQTLMKTLMHGWPLADEKEVRALKPKSRYIHRALQFIHRNLADRIALDDIISAVGSVSARTLQERFKEELGLSPMQYVIKTRLRLAHEELVQDISADTIAAIAARHGFTHLSDFQRRYKVEFGRTPAQTRRARQAMLKQRSK